MKINKDGNVLLISNLNLKTIYAIIIYELGD
jgi:hypothetical protein